MPYATTTDNVKLYYEETGSGFPLIFVHEFAGDYRSWEPQVRYFCRRYRCITFNARGYAPSDVPDDASYYSQDHATADIDAVLRHLGISRAHVVGLSMGSFATLHFGLRYPRNARSLVIAGCGSGADPAKRAQFQAEAEATAQLYEREGSTVAAARHAQGPNRVRFRQKDPRGWAELVRMMGEHSARGCALTLRGVQKQRPSLWDLVEAMRKLHLPALIMAGDEDEPCLEPSLLLKRTIPAAGLLIVPNTGHTVNLEEPEAFNHALTEFFAAVEADRWDARDPRSLEGALMGLK
jgi:pimeloyl-ACP methyl ester carboxylesterase